MDEIKVQREFEIDEHYERLDTKEAFYYYYD